MLIDIGHGPTVPTPRHVRRGTAIEASLSVVLDDIQRLDASSQDFLAMVTEDLNDRFSRTTASAEDGAQPLGAVAPTSSGSRPANRLTARRWPPAHTAAP